MLKLITIHKSFKHSRVVVDHHHQKSFKHPLVAVVIAIQKTFKHPLVEVDEPVVIPVEREGHLKQGNAAGVPASMRTRQMG